MCRSMFHFAFIVLETTQIISMSLQRRHKRSVIFSYNYLNSIMPKANDQCMLVLVCVCSSLEKSCI